MTVDSGYSNRFTLCRGCTLNPPHSIHPSCVPTDRHTSVCGSRIIDHSFPLAYPSTGDLPDAHILNYPRARSCSSWTHAFTVVEVRQSSVSPLSRQRPHLRRIGRLTGFYVLSCTSII